MPVKKKKSADNLIKLVDEAMTAFREESLARKAQAEIIYRRQDDDTKDSIERMAQLLTRIARRQMWFGVGKGDRIVRDIPEELIEGNMFYMAVEICKDLAQMDVRVQQFQVPKDLCLECHVEIKPTKKKKGAKRG